MCKWALEYKNGHMCTEDDPHSKYPKKQQHSNAAAAIFHKVFSHRVPKLNCNTHTCTRCQSSNTMYVIFLLISGVVALFGRPLQGYLTCLYGTLFLMVQDLLTYLPVCFKFPLALEHF